MTYAFTFDANKCPEGCRDCQDACQKKNQLPAGVMWRRVIEVASGAGANAFFIYNLSLACNHCIHPKCAGVCPVDAYIIRKDGIILIDPRRCMGCGYCAWACPYGAPQYNPDLGQMTKCNFCFDSIDAGIFPSCVTACPMRVLNFTEIEDQKINLIVKELWALPASEHPYPLPCDSHTEPHLAIKPHPAMSLPQEKKISNREEIKPKKQKSETSLIVFSILMQMAVGAYWAAQWMFAELWNLVEFDAWLLRVIPYMIIGACWGTGGLFSFAHLGMKRNAWRVLAHLRKSRLSREILFVGLFGIGLAISIAPLAWQVLMAARIITSVIGVALIYSMARVYQLQTMPAWNSWHTRVEFFITALISGQLLMLIVLLFESQSTGIILSPVFMRCVVGIMIALLAGELGIWFSENVKRTEKVNNIRSGLIVIAIIVCGEMIITPIQFALWISPVFFLVVMAEEIIGRWHFYEALAGRII